MPETPSIIALVVTWNRKELLRRCLSALQAQTVPVTEILVVDNASTDDTQTMLETDFPLVKIRRLSTNTGGAGGFNEAIRIAQSSEHDFLWLMDDDAWALPDTLEELLKAQSEIEPSPSFVCSRVIDDNDESINIPSFVDLDPTTSWDRYLAKGRLPLKTCSFVSVLFERTRSLEAGLPLAHYFLWLDDAEYTLRLSRKSPGWYVSTSLVNHPRIGGMKNPDLLLEPSEKRIPLYKHMYANSFETHLRHSDRLGRWWFVHYGRAAFRTLRVLLLRKQWRKAVVLLKGVALGAGRGLRWTLRRT